MPSLTTVFSELLKLCPRYQFDKAVERHQGDRYVKTFTTWQQFITMLYSQVKQKDSLRDIESGLMAQSSRWYHMGLTSVRRSTLSDANNQRDHRVFEDLFYHILSRCQGLTPKHKLRFKNPLYSIDSTTIDLCLSVFPWARFRRAKGAIKMHCLYDHSGALPSFMVVTDGKNHVVRAVKENSFPLSPDSIVSVDKAYIDYNWLNSLDNNGVFFVTRAKRNIDCTVTGQHRPASKGVRKDQTICLNGPRTKKLYPRELRLIEYHDEETEKTLVFLTNNFKLAASTIAQIYKSRWQIELFFKWIKQNLKIKTFLGTSRNAVLTQIWIALCAYLVLAWLKFKHRLGYSLQQMLRLLQLNLFERRDLLKLLRGEPEKPINTYLNQLPLAIS